MPRNIFIATVFLAGVLAGLLIPWFGGAYAVQTEPQPVDTPGVSTDADGTAVAGIDLDATTPGPAATPVPTVQIKATARPFESEIEKGESGDNSEEEDESALTWSELQNATFPRGGYSGDSQVTLTDGEVPKTTEDGVPQTAYWLDPVHAFGDLDGDENNDAAVVLKWNGGGSGTFYSIHAVLNRDGQPLVVDGMEIGDRTYVESMVITDGRITLVAYLTGDRGLCCPNRYVALEYTLIDGALEQTGMIDLPEPADEEVDSVGEDDPSVLTWSALSNATYSVTGLRDQNPVTLADGYFQSQSLEQGRFFVVLESESSSGDLDGDGIEDAVVILRVSYGGNSVYYYVHPVLNRGSEPDALNGRIIDESARIHSLDIKNGRIIVVASIHHLTDAHSCPTRLVALEFTLIDGELEQTGMIDLPEPPEDPDRDTG